ncbi:MAG TPA: hypothetical protein VIM19_11115 [Actinomycetes bacterium]
MSAELYDAEMAGAIARPAIDVLPGRKAAKPTAPPPEEPAGALEPPAAEAVVPLLEPLAAPEAPVDSVAEPVSEFTPDAADAEDTPRKFLGMSLRRARKEAEPAATPADEATEERQPVVDEEYPNPFTSLAPAADPVEVPAVAEPASFDPSEETRALRSLLDASEQQRAAAETRAAQAVAYAQQAQSAIQQAQAQAAEAVQKAEAQARSNANQAQDWQIRHREAESTIAELAQSVANAESRLADQRDQLNALTAERDELLAALEDATSPDRAQA